MGIDRQSRLGAGETQSVRWGTWQKESQWSIELVPVWHSTHGTHVARLTLPSEALRLLTSGGKGRARQDESMELHKGNYFLREVA